METKSRERLVLKAITPGKSYGTTALRAARHFWAIDEGARATDLADELQLEPEAAVVCVLDAKTKPLGIIERDRLFALLGKPFGREILGRMPARELAEPAPLIDVHAGIFAVAQEALASEDDEGALYRVLVGSDGGFQGILSTRDLAAFMSRMTRDDIELAARLQERLQEGNEPIGGAGWAFEAWSRPAKGVGGDFWFTRVLGDGRVFITLCDVSGKGVAASLVVAMVWGMLRMYDFRNGLSSLVCILNEAIVSTFQLEKYLTGFFAVFDPSNDFIEVADMGHSHAFLFREGRARGIRYRNRNLPIGVEAVIKPSLARWKLEADDALLVYSDGLTEQEDAEGREYGERRLALAASQALARGESLREVLPARIDGHRGKTPQQDDMSFMLLSLARKAGTRASPRDPHRSS